MKNNEPLKIEEIYELSTADVDKARKEYLQLIENKNSTELEILIALSGLIQIEENANETEKVLKYSNKQIEMSINVIKHSGLNESIFALLTITHIKRASALEKYGKLQEAVNDYNEVINLYSCAPQNIKTENLSFAYEGLASIQIRVAQQQEETEQIKTLQLALGNLNNAIQISPDSSPNYIFLAFVYKLLNNKKLEEKNYEKAIIIELNKVRDDLPEYKIYYKYRKIDKNCIKGLKERKIFFNDPRNYNDPFDCPIYKGSNYINNSAFSNVLNKIKICCFSKVKDSILMWSHYADSHKGICIGYKIKIKDIKTLNLHIGEINYIDKINKMHEGKFRGILYESFYKKSTIWRYEEEIRVIGFAMQNDYIEMLEIQEIIFGANCTIKNKKKVMKLFKKEDQINFYKVNAEDVDNFKLSIQQI